MFFSAPFPQAFGLDISDLSIKLVQLTRHAPLRKNPFFTLDKVRGVTLPPGYIINGELEQPELVRKKIIFLLGSGKDRIKTPWVVANLPEPQTFIKLISIDAPTSELTYDDVSYYASRHLPFDLSDAYLDWQAINSDSGLEHSQVLLAAVPKRIVDSYTYLLESVGLNPLALEAESISIARSMITETKDYHGEARAILDLGATRSVIIIYDKNSVQFSSTLGFSGEQITTALMQGLKIDRESAEKLKIRNGISYDKTNPAYLQIIDELVEKLVLEIKKALHFYKEHFNDSNPITHITMCGGVSNASNLETVLSKKLHISAHPGNAWKNIFSKVDDATRSKGPALASAIGLALRAAQNPLEKNI